MQAQRNTRRDRSGQERRPADPVQSARLLRRHCPLRPTLGVILGSGFQTVLSDLKLLWEMPSAQLPGFPRPGVSGHAGKIVVAHCGRLPVLFLGGRSHFYEGLSMEQVTFPVRVLAQFGIRDLILTNAAGGIHQRLRPGDFLLVRDHINAMGLNPLRGPVPAGLERFVDLTEVYDARLRRLLKRAARQVALRLTEGIYLAVAGPSYETPAEIEAFARLGADAVGMSTVPEAIVARQQGLAVAALSCIANLAAGRKKGVLSHQEVLQMAGQAGSKARELLCTFAKLYEKEQPGPVDPGRA
jgi:purine-nucleoside phosphorylase